MCAPCNAIDRRKLATTLESVVQRKKLANLPESAVQLVAVVLKFANAADMEVCRLRRICNADIEKFTQ